MGREHKKDNERLEPKWLLNQFNYGATPEDVKEIQDRAQKRNKHGELIKQFEENFRKITKDEEGIKTNAIMALYIHTAYEVGKEAAYDDIDYMMNKAVDEHFKQKEQKNESV